VHPLVPSLAMLSAQDSAVGSAVESVRDGHVDREAHAGVHERALAAAYAAVGAKASAPRTVALEGVLGAARTLAFSSCGEYLAAYAEREGATGSSGAAAEGDASFDMAAHRGDLTAAMTASAGTWPRVLVVWRWTAGRLVTVGRPSGRLTRIRIRPVAGEAPDCALVRSVLVRAKGKDDKAAAGRKKKGAEEEEEAEAEEEEGAEGGGQKAAAAAASFSSSADGRGRSAAESSRPPAPAPAPKPVACVVPDRLFLTGSGDGRLRSFRLTDDSSLKEASLLTGASSGREEERFVDHAWTRCPKQLAAELVAASPPPGATAADTDPGLPPAVAAERLRSRRRLAAAMPAWGFGPGPGGGPLQGSAIRHMWAVAVTASNVVFVISPRGPMAAELAVPTGRETAGSGSDVRQFPRTYELRSVMPLPVPQLMAPLGGQQGGGAGYGAGRGGAGATGGRRGSIGSESAMRGAMEAACCVVTSRGFAVGGSGGYLSLLEAVDDGSDVDAAAAAAGGGGAAGSAAAGPGGAPIDQRPSGFRPLQSFVPGTTAPVTCISAAPGQGPLLLALPGHGLDAGLRLLTAPAHADIRPPNADPTDPLFGRGAHAPGSAVRGVSTCVAQSTAATVGADRTIRVFSLDRRRCDVAQVAEAGDDPLAVALHPSGYTLAVGCADRVRLYNVCASMRQLDRWLDVSSSRVAAIAYSPDGGRLAFAAGREVHVHSALTMRGLVSLKKHQARVTTLSWSADSSRIVSAAEDGAVYVWNSRRGTPIEALGAVCKGLAVRCAVAERVPPRDEDDMWSAVAPAVQARRAAEEAGTPATGATGAGPGVGGVRAPKGSSVRVGAGAASGAGSAGTARALPAPLPASSGALSGSADIVVVVAGSSLEASSSSSSGSGRFGRSSGSRTTSGSSTGSASTMALVQRGDAVKLRTAAAAADGSAAFRDTSAVSLTSLVLDVASKTLYAGTTAGTVRAYAWPLAVDPATILDASARPAAGASASPTSRSRTVSLGGASSLRHLSFAEPDFSEIALHAGPVTALSRSPDGAYLTSAGADGTLFVLAIPRAAGPPATPGGPPRLTWSPPAPGRFNSSVSLVGTKAVRDLQRVTDQLKRERDEAAVDTANRLDMKEHAWKQRMDEQRASLEAELARERAALAELRSRTEAAARASAEERERLAEEHRRELTAEENHHEARLTDEMGRFDKVQEEMERLRQRAAVELQRAAMEASERLAAEQAAARGREEELRAELEAARAEAEAAGRRAEATLRDVEAEYETEMTGLSASVTAQRDETRRTATVGEARATKLRKLHKDAETKQRTAERLREEAKSLMRSTEHRLRQREERIAALGRKAESDAEAQEAAAQEAAELRSSLTQLHNMRFVLEHAKETMESSQRPMAEKVTRLARKLAAANAELEGKERQLAELGLHAQRLQSMAAAMGTREQSATSRAARHEGRLRALLHDVEMLSLLGDERAVAAAAMDLYRRHVKGETGRSKGSKQAVVDTAMGDLVRAELGQSPTPEKAAGSGGRRGTATPADMAVAAAVGSLPHGTALAGMSPEAASAAAPRTLPRPAGSSAPGSAAGSAVPMAAMIARDKRSQEAMAELKAQRDAVRRGVAALHRKVKSTSSDAARVRGQAVEDNSALLGECNRLKRELEAARTEVRRLRLEARRAASAAAHATRGAQVAGGSLTSSLGSGPAAASSAGFMPRGASPPGAGAIEEGKRSSAGPPVAARRGKRTDALGKRPAASASLPRLPGAKTRSADGTPQQRGLGMSGPDHSAQSASGSALPVRSVAAMERQVAEARREAAEATASTVSLVGVIAKR